MLLVAIAIIPQTAIAMCQIIDLQIPALSTFDGNDSDLPWLQRVTGFDSGEGARETASTSKEGSRRANYPIPVASDNEDSLVGQRL